MRTISYSAFRENMKSELQQCRDNAESVLIANRDESENAVVMNVRDYDALMETLRIYENPYLHDKILRGMEQIGAGKGEERELLDA